MRESGLEIEREWVWGAFVGVESIGDTILVARWFVKLYS